MLPESKVKFTNWAVERLFLSQENSFCWVKYIAPNIDLAAVMLIKCVSLICWFKSIYVIPSHGEKLVTRYHLALILHLSLTAITMW